MPLTVADIVTALTELGGEAFPADIARRIRETASDPLPKSLNQNVRARLQENSSDSRSLYKGNRDLFYSVHGIGAGVWGLRSLDPLNPGRPDNIQDGPEAFIDAPEGRLALRAHLRQERSRLLVLAFKAALKSLECCICRFDFEEAYGPLGAGYIEAHHVVPVSQLKPNSRTTIEDLVGVCANCHQMLHRNGLMDWRELRARMIFE